MTNELPDLLASLHAIRQQKAALEKTEKAVLAELKPLVDPELDALEKSGASAVVSVDGLALMRVVGTSRTISADLLLERGVAPDVIAYATKTTTYYQYRVMEVRERRSRKDDCRAEDRD